MTGTKLMKERNKIELTRKEFAHALGISNTQLYNWEKKGTEINSKYLGKITAILSDYSKTKETTNTAPTPKEQEKVAIPSVETTKKIKEVITVIHSIEKLAYNQQLLLFSYFIDCDATTATQAIERVFGTTTINSYNS